MASLHGLNRSVPPRSAAAPSPTQSGHSRIHGALPTAHSGIRAVPSRGICRIASLLGVRGLLPLRVHRGGAFERGVQLPGFSRLGCVMIRAANALSGKAVTWFAYFAERTLTIPFP